MKILFVSDVPLKNPTSGSEQMLNQQASRLALDGMEIFAITRQVFPPQWIIRNVGGVREGTYRASAQDMARSFFSFVRYPPKFYNYFLQGNPFTAVICHQPFNCIALLIYRNFRRIPMLYNFHSPSHEEYLLSHVNENRLKNSFNVKVRKIIERLCLKRASKIMVESRYMGIKLRQIHQMPTELIEVNPGGVDLKRFVLPKNRNILKKELNFPEGKIHLLTVRNLEPRMGLDNLLEVVSMLKKSQVGVHLIIGGEGIERKNLENLVVKYGLDNNVSMVGFVPPNQLPQYYGAADFFILPTRSLEGFGLVTPESMACGTPVLGTPVGGTKEILSGFDPQFLFRDTSPEAMAEGIRFAIEEYFHDKNKYNELRLCCREYAEKNYSWERHIDQLKSILEEILPLSLSQSAQRH